MSGVWHVCKQGLADVRPDRLTQKAHARVLCRIKDYMYERQRSGGAEAVRKSRPGRGGRTVRIWNRVVLVGNVVGKRFGSRVVLLFHQDAKFTWLSIIHLIICLLPSPPFIYLFYE